MTTPVDQWLEQHAYGYGDLSAEERTSIRDFSMLWSLFEAKHLDCNGSANRIRKWATRDEGNVNDYADPLNHFRERYFVGGSFTENFSGLNLRASDCPDLVKDVLSGKNLGGIDQVAAIFIIILRLRNNLFHGTKWSYGIRGQLENFKHANCALMTALQN